MDSAPIAKKRQEKYKVNKMTSIANMEKYSVQGKRNKLCKKEFYVVIEKDEDGFFVGEVPALKGCYAQGRNVDELMRNMRDVIGMCLEDEADPVIQNEFIGVQKVSIENEPANA